MTGPPIMPSTQTRTKLRAFQLDAALPLDPEKENRLEAPVQADSTQLPAVATCAVGVVWTVPVPGSIIRPSSA